MATDPTRQIQEIIGGVGRLIPTFVTITGGALTLVVSVVFFTMIVGIIGGQGVAQLNTIATDANIDLSGTITAVQKATNTGIDVLTIPLTIIQTLLTFVSAIATAIGNMGGLVGVIIALAMLLAVVFGGLFVVRYVGGGITPP